MPIRFDKSCPSDRSSESSGAATPTIDAAHGGPPRCTITVPPFSRDRRPGDIREARPLHQVVAALSDRSELPASALSDWLCHLADCLDEDPAGGAEPALQPGGPLACFNTPLACAVAAVDADPRNPAAWNCLGVEISRASAHAVALPDGTAYTERAAYLKALAVDKDHAAAWCNLGADAPDGALEVEGVLYTEEELLVRAVELNEYRAASWSNVASLLRRRGGHETVRIHGYDFTEKMARVRALQAGPRAHRAFAYWDDLANVMGPADTAGIDGRVLTTVDVAVRAVELKPCAAAWNTLGVAIASGKHREVRCLSGRVSTLACFVRGLEADPEYNSLWRNLEHCLSRAEEENPTVVVRGCTVTLDDCRSYAAQQTTFPPPPSSPSQPQLPRQLDNPTSTGRALMMAAAAGLLVSAVSALSMHTVRFRRVQS